MRKGYELGLVLIVAVGAAACGGAQPERAAASKKGERATAWINPKSGSAVYGSATFVKNGGQIDFEITVEGATPGEHAVHIHEKGDCSAEDGSSAGGHWNPTTENHGAWGHPPHHLGDLGNLVAGEDGKGSLKLKIDRWSIGTGQPNDIVGKSIIVHEKVDDFTTQPTGNAGGRVGCGVIQEG